MQNNIVTNIYICIFIDIWLNLIVIKTFRGFDLYKKYIKIKK